MSARAKIQAEEIALMPNLRQQVSRHDPQAIQAFMQQIAAHSDASFIVIGDRQEFICSFRPSGWVGTDWSAATTGGTGRKSITTIRKGGLGSRCAAKRPSLMTQGV